MFQLTKRCLRVGHMQNPELTEVQKLKLENFTLRHIAFEAQLRQNQLDRAQFLHSVELEHPGWRWQDPQGLVPKEDPPDEYEATQPYPEMTPN
jgi:hypothetical protein